MKEEESNQQQDTMHELAKAQKTLDEIEAKMRNFKSKKKQQARSTIPKAPFPDLNKYFSFLSQEYPSNAYQSLYSQNTAKQQRRQDFPMKKGSTAIDWHFDKQNESLNINLKLENEKNESISKIQEYYCERNEALEAKIKELKDYKQKLKKDQKLLVRNNEELEDEIEKQREGRQVKSLALQLKIKTEELKGKVASLQQQNRQIAARKKQMEKCIKQALKGHKITLNNELQARSKSSSTIGKCKYH